MSEEFDIDTGEVLPLPEYRPSHSQPMPMPPEIGKAIVAVKKQVKSLAKDEENKFARFKYVSVDAFYEAIGPLMANAGLVLFTDEVEVITEQRETTNDQGQLRTSVWLVIKYDLTLYHESGASYGPKRRTMMVPATGPQAFGAAESYVEKYYLRGLFKVPTGEQDADAEKQDALPPRRVVSRAYPAVAPDDRVRAEARTAYRKVQAYIDGAKTAEAMAEVFDAGTGGWSGVFAAEIELIRSAAPDSLLLLRERLTKRLERIANTDPFGLARAPTEEATPSEPGGFPTPDSASPPMAASPGASVGGGGSLLYPERAEEKPATRRVPRQRSERADD